MDAAQVQQMAEQQARRAGADNAHLRSGLLHMEYVPLPQRVPRAQRNVSATGRLLLQPDLSLFTRSGQNDLEYRTAVLGVVIRDDRSAVAFDDRFDYRQSEPAAA